MTLHWAELEFTKNSETNLLIPNYSVKKISDMSPFRNLDNQTIIDRTLETPNYQLKVDNLDSRILSPPTLPNMGVTPYYENINKNSNLEIKQDKYIDKSQIINSMFKTTKNKKTNFVRFKETETPQTPQTLQTPQTPQLPKPYSKKLFSKYNTIEENKQNNFTKTNVIKNTNLLPTKDLDKKWTLYLYLFLFTFVILSFN